RAGKIHRETTLKRMRTFRKADGVGKLFEWTDRLPRRCYSERSVVAQTEAVADVNHFAADTRIAANHLFRFAVDVGLFGAVPATISVKRRSALPRVAFYSNAKFVQNGGRDRGRP